MKRFRHGHNSKGVSGADIWYLGRTFGIFSTDAGGWRLIASVGLVLIREAGLPVTENQEGGRRHAVTELEFAREMGAVLEADVVGDRLDAALFFEQFGCMNQPLFVQLFAWGASEKLPGVTPHLPGADFQIFGEQTGAVACLSGQAEPGLGIVDVYFSHTFLTLQPAPTGNVHDTGTDLCGIPAFPAPVFLLW